MPWADALWAVTYNSHKKGTGYGLALYRIDDDFKSERVHVHDGTHANRLIHSESNQCFIGPYAIDYKGNRKHILETPQPSDHVHHAAPHRPGESRLHPDAWKGLR
ncbi:MAG: hypothetical protein QM757_03395 [Paludibaculum sp.]